MITPSFGLTVTERALPNMALDFTTAVLDPRVTFTRSGDTATVTNSLGIIVSANANIPRFDYNPTTLLCKGLLIEEPRTNSLLNSLIDGTNLATQTVTVTAVARTLSFYGTGEIILSGAQSATVTGTGAYPVRKIYTFTPSAGALTLTVTGTVQFAQLELGVFSTSYIPTEAAAVTRNADAVSMTGANFSDWYNASEGTFAVNAYFADAGALATDRKPIFYAGDGVSNVSNLFEIGRQENNGNPYMRAITFSGASSQTSFNMGFNVGQPVLAAMGYKVNNVAGAINGGNPVADTSATMPVGVNKLIIGANTTISMTGWIRSFRYWPQRLTNNEIRAFSK